MKVGSLKEAKEDMQKGVCNFTVEGNCSNCGACCTDLIPLREDEVKRIKAFVERNHIKEHVHLVPTMKPVYDVTCPFRNEEERKCDIYPVRPDICRKFKCDLPQRQIQANKEETRGKCRIVFMREEFFGE